MDRKLGWVVVAVIAFILLVGAVLTGAIALGRGNWLAVITTPIAFAFWYWIAAGAWRRSGRPTAP